MNCWHKKREMVSNRMAFDTRTLKLCIGYRLLPYRVCVWSVDFLFFLLSAPCSVCNKTQFNRRCINVRWTIKRSRRWELILITNFQETVESKSTEQMFYRQTLLFLNEKQFGRSAFREETQKKQQIMQTSAFLSSIELGAAKSINSISLEIIRSAF